jgi:broad specificity polyphosphatase/5'/3'-nucleotidase SurE
MKVRYLVITISLLTFIASSNAIARVLPVYEEADSQEEFIMLNINMPDIDGNSEDIVKEGVMLQNEFFVQSSINLKYDSNNIPYLFITSINILPVEKEDQSFCDKHNIAEMDLHVHSP